MADNITLPGAGIAVATDDLGGGLQVQRFKAGFGTDGAYSDVAPDNGMPTTGGAKAYTASTSATADPLIGPVDALGFRAFSIILSGTFSATLSVQGSNDGVTWNTLPMVQVSAAGAIQLLVSSLTAINGNGVMFTGPLPTRYIKVRCTSYTSGAVTANLVLFSSPPVPFTYVLGGEISTEGEVFSPTADAKSGSVSAMATAGYGFLYNGATWDRARAASSAAGTTGTGIPAAGALGWDGTNYQRLACDTAGYLLTKPAPMTASAVTQVGSSLTVVPLLAANTARLGASIYNDSTAYLYLKLGSAAAANSFTYKCPPGGYYEALAGYKGVITGLWDAVNGNSYATELT